MVEGSVIVQDARQDRAWRRARAREERASRTGAGDLPWYVVQVMTGRESRLRELICREAGPEVLIECFIPSFEVQKKIRGTWRVERARLFPGYVFVVTGDIEELKLRLRRVPEFARLLTVGESFVALEASERAWLAAFTTADDRVIPMSMGAVEGDRIVVTQGPLMGREGWIVRVNRRKSLAFIQVEMFGRKIETKIGLGIVRKQACSSDEEQRHTKRA